MGWNPQIARLLWELAIVRQKQVSSMFVICSFVYRTWVQSLIIQGIWNVYQWEKRRSFMQCHVRRHQLKNVTELSIRYPFQFWVSTGLEQYVSISSSGINNHLNLSHLWNVLTWNDFYVLNFLNFICW